MAYSVALRPAAARQLGKVSGPLSVALHGAILSLGGDPRPPGTIKLVGRSGLWRTRLRIFGQPWRIVYQIDDRARLVRVVRIAPRDEGTYRGLR